MAKFDEVYAELQAKMAAAIQVIAQHPELAAQVRDAIDGAQTAAEIAEAQAQDDARANALSAVITDVRAVLQQVAPRPDDTPPPPLVEEEPLVEEPLVEEPLVEEPLVEEPFVEPEDDDGSTGEDGTL